MQRGRGPKSCAEYSHGSRLCKRAGHAAGAPYAAAPGVISAARRAAEGELAGKSRSDARRSLERIAAALERLAPPRRRVPDLSAAEAFVWHAGPPRLQPVPNVNRVALPLLKGIDRSRDTLLENTHALRRRPAGQQRAALGCARHGQELAGQGGARCRRGRTADGRAPLKLIEIHREDIETLPELMTLLRDRPERFILFCDDLSFDPGDTSYKSLKAALEGGIEGRPDNVVFYATSNRRHLLPRDMIENERSTAINPSEAVQEKVSLSDRFGLWLGFHNCSQDEFLAMVAGYIGYFGVPAAPTEWQPRGARMGDDARQPLRPRRLAIRPGSGGAKRRQALRVDGALPLLPLREKLSAERTDEGDVCD